MANNRLIKMYSVSILVHDKEHPDAVLNSLKQLTKDEYEKAVESIRRINKWLKDDIESFALLEYSYSQFIKTLDGIHEEFASPTLVRVDDKLVAINADFISFLIFKEMYIDHTSKKIGSTNKSILEAFTKTTNDAFDKSFPYRFFCQLENYSKHIAMPIKGLNVSNSIDEQTSKGVSEMKLYFIRDELLEHKKNWTNKVLPDLKNQQEHIPVLPFIQEVMKLLRKIHHTALSTYKDIIAEDIKLIDEYSNYATGKSQRPFLIKFEVNEMNLNQGTNIVMKELPEQVIKYYKTKTG